MTPLQHREPGVVGALLADTRATVGVIPDGVHVHPSILTWLVKAKGIERITLVTDQMAAAGLEAGEYRLGDRRVLVDESSARLEDGTLAGSILTLDQGIRNLVAWRACSPAEALTMASTTPARLLGLDHLGRIEGGCTADLVVLDPDLNVRQTIIDGQVVFE
jgi:N-acetylglucosamine-6-phosphate deacetylase